MAGDLVLLTGGTGFLGYSVLLSLLSAGYRVRAAVRSTSKLDKLRAAPSLRILNPSPERLSFVTVPDMAVPGAYDAAVEGVKYIVHVAAQIPNFGEGYQPKPEEMEKFFVEPAVTGTIGLLDSAAKAGTVKRIVITSSTVAFPPFEAFIGTSKEPERLWTSEDRTPVSPGPYSFQFQAYSASKTAALLTAERYVREKKPSFDLIPIAPSWIFGRDELVTDVKGLQTGDSTNKVLMGLLTGSENPDAYGGNAVFVEDAARAHVLALREDLAGNQAFIVNTQMVWEDALDVAERVYPEAFADGRLKRGKQPTSPLAFDSIKAEKVLGLEYHSYEHMVLSVVKQYLELLAEAQSA